MITVDGRCDCHRCVERTTDIYRMVGSCSNCGTGSILMLFRVGDPVRALNCPTCGNYHTVHSNRGACAYDFAAAPREEGKLSDAPS